MRHISEVIASAFPWKRCSKCGKGKPLNQFYRLAKSKDGRRPDCKECQYKPARQVSSQERFWSKVVKTTSGCWEWQGSTNTNNGYGRFWDNGHHVVAHRYSWEIHSGKIEKGLEVCHSCDNPSCVNPAHLFLATHKENMQDMVKKGRHAACHRGNNPMAKLSGKQVKCVRDKYATGKYTHKALAKEYGVSENHIGRITRKEVW